MKKKTRENQVTKMITAGLNSLFKSQDTLSLDEFTMVVLEALMLLEREDYLKGHNGEKDSANGSYKRSFSSLRRNNLQISIPRSRNVYL